MSGLRENGNFLKGFVKHYISRTMRPTIKENQKNYSLSRKAGISRKIPEGNKQYCLLWGSMQRDIIAADVTTLCAIYPNGRCGGEKKNSDKLKERITQTGKGKT